MSEFEYNDPFPVNKDNTKYRLLTKTGISSSTFNSQSILQVQPEPLIEITRQAFNDVNFFYRTHHLQSLQKILDDPESSNNDRFVALALLKNAVIAADEVLPSCQDTGTAIVFAKKGQKVWTDFNDHEVISRGIFRSYTEENLRYSQNIPLSMYTEKNSGSNLPAQIDIQATGGDTYELLYMAKGGGSANKMFLFQETRAMLNPQRLPVWIAEKLKTLGTAACPPYHLALVIGGTSAEFTMKTLKLATAGYLNNLPKAGNSSGSAFRDYEMENIVLRLAQDSGIGAQFGGKYFAHDVKVVRLPRHGASLPVGLGVSCSADRNIKAKITHNGAFLEQLDTDPARFLPIPSKTNSGKAVAIDLNQPVAQMLSQLTKHSIGTRLSLSGTLIVARDIAHARLKEEVESGLELPSWFTSHPVYYAGPAKKPDNYASGSFGPTTAGRMDSYVDFFQKRGASLIMLAKGNRSRQVTEACKVNRGFYLGSIGGPAAALAHDSIISVRPVAYEELGMEAVWKIEVKDFPAFIVIDDKGNDFFAQLA